MTKDTSRADDERILEILDAYECQGLSRARIKERFGISTGQLAGILDRCLRQLGPNLSADPAHRDGALGRRWWKT